AAEQLGQTRAVTRHLVGRWSDCLTPARERQQETLAARSPVWRGYRECRRHHPRGFRPRLVTAAPKGAVTRSFLDLELGVDDVVRPLLAAGRAGAGPGALAALRAGGAVALDEPRQALRRRLQVADRLADRLHVLAAGRLLGAVDGAADRRLLRLA